MSSYNLFSHSIIMAHLCLSFDLLENCIGSSYFSCIASENGENVTKHLNEHSGLYCSSAILILSSTF